jgi:hypothetical protein
VSNFYPKYPIVLVEWQDAMTIKDNWHAVEKELEEPATCLSVGYLVAKNKKLVTLYAHIALEDKWTEECGKGNMIIPVKMIKSIKYLKPVT